ITIPAFCNVMEQGSQIEQVRRIERGKQPAAERELMVELAEGKAPQVTQHVQYVFIDRIDMKQVMLHLPDDTAEGRDIPAQNTVAIHQPESVRYTHWRLQNPDKEFLVFSGETELPVHQIF